MQISRRNFLTNSAVVVCGSLLSTGLESCSIGKLLYSSRNIPIIDGKPVLSLSTEPLLQKIGGAVKKRFGTVNDGNVILVVRREEKQFIALAGQCTHMGAEVNGPIDGILTCPFHGSQYHAADGTVTRGPAEEPLRRFDVLFDESTQEILIQEMM